MANISSFFGTLYFNSTKNPWTPEGYILAYDILMSIDASGGDYGICMEEEHTENSADFLMYLMSQGDKASISFWGNGRWSAENNFHSFESWTDHKKRDQTMSEETYKVTREKFLSLAAENGWTMQFDYTDEESGNGFIYQQSVDIVVKQDPSTFKYEFTPNVTTVAAEDYTLDAYCRLVEEEDDITHCEMFNQTIDEIAELLNINKDDVIKFTEFFIEKEWHFKIPPYSYHDDVEDLPEGFVDQWKEYCDGKTSESVKE